MNIPESVPHLCVLALSGLVRSGQIEGWGKDQPPQVHHPSVKVSIPLALLGRRLPARVGEGRWRKDSLQNEEVCCFRISFLPESTRHWVTSPLLP